MSVRDLDNDHKTCTGNLLNKFCFCLQVKKNIFQPKLRAQGTQNDAIIFNHIVMLTRTCDSGSVKFLFNIIGNVPLSTEITRETVQTKEHTYIKAEMSCDICDKTYISKYHLEKHTLGHYKTHSAQSYKCEECGVCFDTESNLSKHRKTCGKRPIANRNSGCPQCVKCGVFFAFQSTLQDHQKTCRNEPKTVREGAANVPQRWASDQFANVTQDESPVKTQDQQASSAPSVDTKKSVNEKDVCKFCGTKPVDMEKHYTEEHNIWDPSSILCDDCSFLVPSANKQFDDQWLCDQYSKAMECCTDNNICRLCSKDQSYLTDHYQKYHKVKPNLLSYTTRVMREFGVDVPGADMI